MRNFQFVWTIPSAGLDPNFQINALYTVSPDLIRTDFSGKHVGENRSLLSQSIVTIAIDPSLIVRCVGAQAASLDRLVLPARLNESGGNGFTLVGESGNVSNILNFR
jgi:hypothetical protein